MKFMDDCTKRERESSSLFAKALKRQSDNVGDSMEPAIIRSTFFFLEKTNAKKYSDVLSHGLNTIKWKESSSSNWKFIANIHIYAWRDLGKEKMPIN